MTTIDEMDEFVNWDNATSSLGPFLDPSPDQVIDPALTGMSGDTDLESIGLALANVAEDDFSFSALQHFSNSSMPSDTAVLDGVAATNSASPPSQLFWESPVSPCASCSIGGYSCKKIREGRYRGYCTSCVALRVDCSFGGGMFDNLAADDAAASVDAWDTMADEPANTVAERIAHEPMPPAKSFSGLNMASMANSSESDSILAAAKAAPPPKIGARFSRESLRVLKTWLNTHNRHPFPSDEEKEMLQRQTGLSKMQITNWFANARRRGKVQPPRPTSPLVSSLVGNIDIPQRRGTPAVEHPEAMNPLQRWEHSPPEHEPASVTAIARAVTASSSALSSGLNSPFSLNYTDDGSGKSLCNQSSTSSLGTSHSSGNSLQSAYSHGSRNSWGSFGSAAFSNTRSRRRRRRRTAKAGPENTEKTFSVPLKTFQCTFCTETFRTKHDWQRHEKSLHLSLERWVCTPDGPKAISPENGKLSCIFCGLVDPDDDHVESHNHAACQERSLEERTFYRKDHLNQHLRLVHNVKFTDWSMKAWKVASPEIRSRCGFCGVVMDTWTIRVDHLAEHFKTGYSMADWKGDWGFDVPVLDMVENSIPPYLIHYERTSPMPYVASRSPLESPRNAYELIKLEMSYFGANHVEQHGRPPTDEEMMIEGCRIIFASELLSLQGIATQTSWFRDLIMKSESLVRKARFGPLRGAAENRLATLKINGKDNLFEACPMESLLHEFVTAKTLLGLTAMDDELQEEACRIVGRVEEVSTNPSEPVANWLIRLIKTSTDWLASFRRRAHLPRTEDVHDQIIRSRDPKSIDSTIHNFSRLERELADYVKVQRSAGVEPSDEDLQREARIIIYEFDDGWNQTAADSLAWLQAFRERHPADGSSPTPARAVGYPLQKGRLTTISAPIFPPPAIQLPGASARPPADSFDLVGVLGQSVCYGNSNCYEHLLKELGRWVAATMSPNNPNRHVPSDAELQHQARWIVYNEDDPWNQTAADNAEWLRYFKRHVGIVIDDDPHTPGDHSRFVLESGPDAASRRGLVADESAAQNAGTGSGLRGAGLEPTAMPNDVDINISDEELGNMLQDMEFEFDPLEFEGRESMDEQEDAGGVSLRSDFF